MKRKIPVSVIIPVRNEAQNITECLASVDWADEIFVVDSMSQDETAALAQQRGATVVQFHYRPGGPRKKNWALQHLSCRNEWILLLDADERCTPAFEEELRGMLANPTDHCGYYVNRQHFFLGRWLRYGGNYPSWNLRLLRRGAGRFERLGTEALQSAGDVEVHEHIVLEGTAGYLASPLVHHDFKDLHQFIDRHNRYSTWDATMRESMIAGVGSVDSIRARFFGTPVERKRFLKRIWVHLPAKPMLRFLYMYVLRAGFLDGYPGFLYACFKAIQEFHIGCKQYEKRLANETTASTSTTVTVSYGLAPTP